MEETADSLSGATQGVECIGMIGVQPDPRDTGATVHGIGGGIDPDYGRRFACAHAEAGFDTVLVGYTSTAADGFSVASYASAVTTRLRFLAEGAPPLSCFFPRR